MKRNLAIYRISRSVENVKSSSFMTFSLRFFTNKGELRKS
jgi:hypothetical protein